jgi:hypothetical protein
MRFRKLNLAAHYILRPTLRGAQIHGVHDPAFDAVRYFFAALERAHLFLPLDEQEFAAGASALLAANEIARPVAFAAPVQYFVHSQLHYLVRRICAADWSVQHEISRCPNSPLPFDLRVLVAPDDFDAHDDFSIWFHVAPCSYQAVDRHAQDVCRTMPLVASSARGRPDILVSFIYAGGSEQLRKMPATAAALERKILRTHAMAGHELSTVIMYLTQPDPHADTLVDGQLSLYDGALMRFAGQYFQGQNGARLQFDAASEREVVGSR